MLIFVFSSGLRFLAALYAGTLIVFLFSEVRQNSGLCAASLESLESAVQRFILFYAYF